MTTAFPTRVDCVLPELLRTHASRIPDDVFAVFESGDAWTYGETVERTWRCANALRALGLEQREPLVSWLPNGKEALLSWFGAAAAGLTFTPLNTAYRGALLEHALNLLRARVLVAHAGLVDRLAGLDLPHLEQILVVGDAASLPREPRPTIPWDEVAGCADVAPPALRDPIQPWDDQMVMFTGGTTGASKAVRRPNVLYLKMCEASFDHVGIGAHDRFFVCAPMFHGGADVPIYSMLRHGGSVAIVDGFSTSRFWHDVRRYACTVAWVHSAMAHFLWEQPATPRDRDHPLRLAMQAPLIPTHREFADRFGTRLYTVYGMTELPCPFSVLDPVDHRTLGKPWDADVDVRVVDEHDCEVSDGVPGELLVRHRVPWAITPGYLHDAEATAAVWRNGWFHSGDVFVRSAEGDYALIGRVKDSIRRRGENVSAAEVERELAAHPGIAEAAVIGVEVAVEEEVMAFLVPGGDPPTPDAVIAFVTDRLPYYAVPRFVELVDELPRTVALRPDKKALQARGLTAETWDRERAGIRLRRERL
jgi:crotonobetaine/carnitine-CoA ligase